MKRSSFLALSCLLGLSSCTRKDPPAPVSYGYEAETPKNEQIAPLRQRPQKRSIKLPVKPPLQQERIVVVEQGDNLSSLADQYDISEEEIKEYNDLRPPYHLFPGQNLNLPASAQKRPRRQIKTVSKLAVEEEDVSSPVKESAPAPAETISLLSKPKKSTPPPRRSLAERERELEAKFRALEESKRDTVKDPKKGTTSDTKAPSKITEPALSKESTSKQNKVDETSNSEQPALKANAQTNNISSPVDEKATSNAQTQPSEPVTALDQKDQKNSSTEKFSWPVKGDIISHFNTGKGKLKNDGINISAAKDTPITAAEEGTVVYVGNEMKAFGTLVLIKHKSGWMTAYGHCGKVFVKPKQGVHKGEKIALVGNSGSVRTPQLHFQLRKKTTMVDPEQYLE